MAISNETRPLGAAGQISNVLCEGNNRDNAPNPEVAQAKIDLIIADLSDTTRCLIAQLEATPAMTGVIYSPNWRPADAADDYLRNCQEGLEEYSARRLAKLLDISRAELWRWQMMASLPDELFDRLLVAKPRPSTKSLANVALALKDGIRPAAEELCPHCGGLLRVRRQVSAEHARVVYDYLCELEARR